MTTEAKFIHLVTTDEDLIGHLIEWKLSLLNCKKYWEAFAQKHGVKRYTSIELDMPKFYFPRGFKAHPGWSSPNPQGWCRPNSVRLKEEVGNLPKPEPFANVCVDRLGLPDIPQLTYDLPYKMIWTKRNRIIIRMLDPNWLAAENGQEYEYPKHIYRQISNERVQYWFALDQLKYRGEEPD